MKKFFLYLVSNLFLIPLFAQTSTGLYRYPDVSKTQIVFTYANDLWVMPKEGGEAEKLSSQLGVESFPRFSPDGKSIAFTGNYDGNKDVYVIPTNGGVPLRLTSHGYTDRVVGWQPDGKRVVFASGRESGRDRFNQMYTIASTGGPAEKLPLAYAEFASYSPDGKELAVTFRTQAFRNWKRYRGGWKANIHIFNLTNNTSENITELNTEAGNEFPIDGEIITAPSFRMYNPDGTWFKEGHGVDPDIQVDEDLGLMSKGIDTQLEKEIEEIKTLLKDKGYKVPATPAYEKRN